jgi:PAS domain S-box-containing protein
MTEAPFREFYEASMDAIVVIDGTGRINFANNRVEAMLGYRSDELLGQPHNILVPERYRDRHLGHMQQYLLDPSPRMMGAGLELTALRKDGSELLVEISLTPYQAATGLAVISALRDITTKHTKRNVLETENSDLRGLLGQARSDAAHLLAQAGIDATENEAAKRLQRLLLEEVHHRMKNMLAMVLAIVSQSLRTADDIEQGELAITSRLTAFGRAQNLLLRANEAGARLDDVVRAAIEPFAGGDRRRFLFSGSPIEIGSGAVLPLTLALN